MMRNYLISILIVLVFGNVSFCQIQISEKAEKDTASESKPDYKYENIALGFGVGNEYSLIGGHFLFYPQKNIGIIAGAGYIFADIGFNAGLKLRLTEQNLKSKTQFYTFGQYGYFSWVNVSNNPNLKKIFYGYTAGIGIDIRFNKPDGNYLSISLSYNFNTDKIKNKIEDYTIKNNLSGESIIVPSAGISIGYHLVQ